MLSLTVILALYLAFVAVLSDSIVARIGSFGNDQGSLWLCDWLLLVLGNISQIDKLSVSVRAHRILKVDSPLVLHIEILLNSFDRVVIVTQ